MKRIVSLFPVLPLALPLLVTGGFSSGAWAAPLATPHALQEIVQKAATHPSRIIAVRGGIHAPDGTIIDIILMRKHRSDNGRSSAVANPRFGKRAGMPAPRNRAMPPLRNSQPTRPPARPLGFGEPVRGSSAGGR